MNTVRHMDEVIVLFYLTTQKRRDHTMNSTASRLNPFAMMLDPEAVISAMEDSLNLRRLRHRVRRPLTSLSSQNLMADRVIERDFDMVIDTRVLLRTR
ncbi:MAG: hypothetical protein R3E42_05990 [Burkholderiaceae bacterium]